jgi:hypothetical protein
MKKNLIFATGIIALTTIIYAFFLYNAEKTDRRIIADRVSGAYNDGQLLDTPIPFYTYGFSSRNNLSGVDQLGESFFVLLFMHQGQKDKRFLDGLMSNYYETVEAIPKTAMARRCISATPEQLADRSVWKVMPKPRQWHGLKAVVMPLLESLDWSQITWLITISTFFVFAIILAQIMYLDKMTGLAYMAFSVCAFYGSSILFFGGITYSVSLLAAAFWNVLWLVLRMSPWQVSRRIELLFITFGGTWLCFFFQQGGETIYAFSFIAFAEVFLTKEKLSTTNLRRVLESWFFFSLGFFGSIVCKHLLILAVSGSLEPLFELWQNIITRTGGTNDAGSHVDLFKIVYAQFYWYGIPAYGIGAIHHMVYYSPILGLILFVLGGVWLSILKFRKQPEKFIELSIALIGFLLVLAPVPLRYMILRNHSDVHLFFVSRYVFVFAGTVYFFAIWLALRARNFLPWCAKPTVAHLNPSPSL